LSPDNKDTAVPRIAVEINIPVSSLVVVKNKLVTGPQSPTVALNATIGLVAT